MRLITLITIGLILFVGCVGWLGCDMNTNRVLLDQNSVRCEPFLCYTRLMLIMVRLYLLRSDGCNGILS